MMHLLPAGWDYAFCELVQDPDPKPAVGWARVRQNDPATGTTMEFDLPAGSLTPIPPEPATPFVAGAGSEVLRRTVSEAGEVLWRSPAGYAMPWEKAFRFAVKEGGRLRPLDFVDGGQ